MLCYRITLTLCDVPLTIGNIQIGGLENIVSIILLSVFRGNAVLETSFTRIEKLSKYFQLSLGLGLNGVNGQFATFFVPHLNTRQGHAKVLFHRLQGQISPTRHKA